MEICMKLKDQEEPLRFLIDDTGPEAEVIIVTQDGELVGQTTVKELRHVGRAFAAI